MKAPSTCKHEVELELRCKDEAKWWLRQRMCARPCGDTLECGHRCSSMCGKCLGGYVHQKCGENCDRVLYCGHKVCLLYNIITFFFKLRLIFHFSLILTFS